MKVFIPLLCIVSLTLAEPPVGDSYALGRSSFDHGLDHDHRNDYQRSFSQEYGPPTSTTRSFGSSQNALSTEYGPPNTRTVSLKSGLSQNYGPPNLRSGISQEYSAPNARNSASYSAVSRGLSTVYGAPNTRSQPSQTYGAPAIRNGIPSLRSDILRTPSSQYGVPELRTPSEEYGAPSQSNFGRNSEKYELPSSLSQTGLSHEYGVPSARSNEFQRSNSLKNVAKSFASTSSRSFKGSAQFGSRTLSTNTGTPATRNSLSTSYGTPAARNSLSTSYGTPTARNSLSTSYGTPAAKNSLSTSYGTPAARSPGTYSERSKALSQTYGAPNQQHLSASYEAPNARDISQEYGLPATYSANQKTSAIASSYSAASRSTPSESYGVPTGRDLMPSEQYGVPEDSLSNQGYSYARDALNEILNQEPANYDFAYKVNDYETGSDFGHTETRQDNRAEGSYFVVLPDGTKQVVEYEADERGFKPKISVEPADFGRSGGYDNNAADLSRSNDGPY